MIPAPETDTSGRTCTSTRGSTPTLDVGQVAVDSHRALPWVAADRVVPQVDPDLPHPRPPLTKTACWSLCHPLTMTAVLGTQLGIATPTGAVIYRDHVPDLRF